MPPTPSISSHRPNWLANRNHESGLDAAVHHLDAVWIRGQLAPVGRDGWRDLFLEDQRVSRG